MLRTLIILAIVFALLLAAWLWWASPTGEPDMDAYHDALDTLSGSTEAIDTGLARFEAAFEDLTAPDAEAAVQAVYADRVHFNDTLITLESGAEVAAYMGETGKRVSNCRVIVEHALRDGPDVFVRWTMHFESKAYGIGIDSKSVGMTHLRFDEEGRVILHQDFWDAAGGLYEHLPLVGAMIRTTKRLMK